MIQIIYLPGVIISLSLGVCGIYEGARTKNFNMFFGGVTFLVVGILLQILVMRTASNYGGF